MRSIRDQRGVALVIEIVLVAIVLSLVGLAVYTESKDKTIANTSPSPTLSASPTPSPSPSPSPTPGFFTITQWGVQAPYTGTDKFTFSIQNSSSGAIATVISSQLAAKYPGCATYGAGQITRVLPTAIASQALLTDSNLTVAQFAKANPALGLKLVGDYYFMFMHDQAVCAGNGTVTDQNQANDLVKGLVANLEPLH